jgi:Mg2+ and Co2+ transporter CorA
MAMQIDNIDNWVKHAQATIPSIATSLIRAQIEQTAGRLENIARELEQIEGKLKKERADGTSKVKRAKWLIKADTVARLLQKARNAKQDLAFAVQWQQKAMVDHLSTALSQHFIQNER